VFPSSSLLCTAQVFAHSNDLNEKDDMILKLKKQESLLETALAATERLQEQDAIVRLQLGKRLEQVLLDKEEAYEELHHFKVMNDVLSSTLRSSVPSSALIPSNPASSASSFLSTILHFL
jgi:hypothetical protein